jgi:hypothetical protein
MVMTHPRSRASPLSLFFVRFLASTDKSRLLSLPVCLNELLCPDNHRTKEKKSTTKQIKTQLQKDSPGCFIGRPLRR